MMHQDHILKHLTIDPTLYVKDIAAIAIPAVHRHGSIEWLYATLTCQLHGHVGIYSLLGVKMGLYACEQMKARFSTLRIISYAGNTPPISCFNDGLQTSTGSTLGHGLIEVRNNTEPQAEAEFISLDDRLHLRLKNDYAEIIQSEVALAQARHGDEIEYWHQIRQLAIRYWLEWDRNSIFERIE